jgi:integrin beta 2
MHLGRKDGCKLFNKLLFDLQDCPQGNDETGCQTCKPGARKCSLEDKCYSDTSKCDGNFDCMNGEDEKGCNSCHGRGFHCIIEKKCISWSWKCDSEKDCSDGSDESFCFCFNQPF